MYASTSRDSLLAAVRDVLQTEVGGCAFSWVLFRFSVYKVQIELFVYIWALNICVFIKFLSSDIF